MVKIVRVVAIIKQNEPHLNLNVAIDKLNLEAIADNTLRLLLQCVFPNENVAANEESAIDGLCDEFGNFHIVETDNVETNTQPLPCAPVNILPSAAIGFSKKIAIPKISVSIGDIITVEMREEERTSTFFFSKQKLNYFGHEQTFCSLPQIRSIAQAESRSVTDAIEPQSIVEIDRNETNDIGCDSDDDTSSTDSSSWGSPLSPETFHANMAALLSGTNSKREVVRRNLFN